MRDLRNLKSVRSDAPQSLAVYELNTGLASMSEALKEHTSSH
jgi:hypothetical protein